MSNDIDIDNKLNADRSVDYLRDKFVSSPHGLIRGRQRVAPHLSHP